MKEGILLAGRSPVYVGWSGPGNKKILKGDANLGYFGIISSNELFTRTQFSNLVGGAGIGGDQLVGVDGWYKFIIGGNKVIYVARAPLRSNVSWEAIYRRSLMYGTDDLGPDPVITKDFEHKNQFMFINKREYLSDEERIHNWFLKPRNLTGYVEPVSDSTDDQLTDWSILRHVFAPASGGTGRFDFELNTDGVLGKHITANRTSTGMMAKIRGGTGLGDASTAPIGQRDGTYLWRPVLELIRDGDKAFEPHYLSYDIPDILSRNFEKWVETSFDSTLPDLAKYNLTSYKHSYFDDALPQKTENVKWDALALSMKQYGLYTDAESTHTPFAANTIAWRADTLIVDETYRIDVAQIDVRGISLMQESSTQITGIDEFVIKPLHVTHLADVVITDETWSVSKVADDASAVSLHQQNLVTDLANEKPDAKLVLPVFSTAFTHTLDDVDFIIGSRIADRHLDPKSRERMGGIVITDKENIDFVSSMKNLDRSGKAFPLLVGLQLSAEEMHNPNTVSDADAWMISNYHESSDNLGLVDDGVIQAKLLDIAVTQTAHFRGLMLTGEGSE